MRRLSQSTLHTEELLRFTLLESFADLVFLLLDSKLVISLQLNFADSTGKLRCQFELRKMPRSVGAYRLVPPKSNARKVLFTKERYGYQKLCHGNIAEKLRLKAGGDCEAGPTVLLE